MPIQRGRSNALVLEGADFSIGRGKDIARGVFANVGGLQLILAKRFDQLSGGILLKAQDAKPFSGAGFDVSRIRPVERGGAGSKMAVDDGVIEGEMMPLEAPTPGAT